MSHRVLAVLSITTAATLLGCTGTAEQPASGPQTKTIEISYDELLNQKQVSRSDTLAVGDFLQISLGSNASTGYRWDEKLLISDSKVLVQTGHQAIAPKDTRPGAAGSEVWMVQAIAPGNATVSATYGRPWEGGKKGEWVFSVNVAVK